MIGSIETTADPKLASLRAANTLIVLKVSPHFGNHIRSIFRITRKLGLAVSKVVTPTRLGDGQVSRDFVRSTCSRILVFLFHACARPSSASGSGFLESFRGILALWKKAHSTGSSPNVATLKLESAPARTITNQPTANSAWGTRSQARQSDEQAVASNFQKAKRSNTEYSLSSGPGQPNEKIFWPTRKEAKTK